MRLIKLLVCCWVFCWMLMTAPSCEAQFDRNLYLEYPTNGAYVSELTELRGRIGEFFGLFSFYGRIQIRRDDGLVWHGQDRTWQPAANNIVSLNANNIVARTSWEIGPDEIIRRRQLTGTNLREGTYTVLGYSECNYYIGVWGWNVNSDLRELGTFTVDKTAPQIAITSFTNGAIVGDLRDLRGTATDALSGINSPLSLGGIVEFSIQRGDDFYWNGNGWSAGALFLPACERDGHWLPAASDRSGNIMRLPGRSDLSAGQTYTITARTADRVDNLAQTSVTVTADFANPSIAITYPTAGAPVRDLSRVSGICGDNVGVSRVNMYIKRDDNRYWSPASRNWTDDPVVLPVTLITPTTWERNEGLPYQEDLRDGTFEIGATAYDTNGQVATDIISMRVDTTPPPAPTFLTPANNSFASSFQNVTGVASRGTGSRLARVDFVLQRLSDFAWWNGSQWVNRLAYLPTSLSPGGFWAVAAPLPPSGQTSEIEYFLTAYATDAAGNRSLPADIRVRIDRTAPTVSITQPIQGATYTSLATVSGTSGDNAGGSGLDRTDVTLMRRLLDGTTQYHIWGTSNWTTDNTVGGLTRPLTPANWSTNLPSLTANGALYLFTATAYDRGGLQTLTSASFRIGSPSGPTVNITSPAHAISLETLTNATGTASDPNGVFEVYVQLMRDNAGSIEYWNWVDAWTTTRMQTTATGTTNWSQALPDLPLGNYALRAWAQNNIGAASAPVESSFTSADNTPPDLTVLTPQNISSHDSLSEVAGTAFDARGVASVRVRLLRTRQPDTIDVYDWVTGEWSMFGSGNVWAEATLDGTTNVQWTLALPQLPGGQYGMDVLASDVSGLVNLSMVHFDINDNIAPQILIEQPGIQDSTLEAISGVVRDDANGSGVQRVDVRIIRGSDNLYWNGTAWAATVTNLPARVMGEDWTLSSGPTHANLADGNYIIQAFARDYMGNVSSDTHGLGIDVSQPANMGITTPAHNSTLQSLSQINGIADDGAAGSGIAFVEVLLTRANGDSWNGTAWTSSQTFLSTTQTAVNNGINWTRTNGLPSGANLAPGTYTVFAVAYDQVGNEIGVSHNFSVAAPSVQFSSATYSVVESGGQATITVTRSSGAGAASINYTASNGTAVKPNDYNEAYGTLNFAAGQLSRTFTVPIINDTLDENDETIRLALNTPVGATLGTPGAATLTIIDNDATPALTIDDVTITEGNPPTAAQNVLFKVTLGAPSGRTVGVNCITANGLALSPADYTATGSTLIFAPGEISKTFSVPVKTDLLDEANEVFYALLSSPVNASIGRGRGVATIVDNDAAPSITIDNLNITEGNGGTRLAVAYLRLSAPSGKAVRVSYATQNDMAHAGSDYVAVAPTSVAFNVGQTVALARVTINGDLLNEPDENFFVNLTSPINGTIADAQGKVTIVNDDRLPALTIDDVAISEGNSGTQSLIFKVSLSAPSGQTVTVNYATANGTAQAGSDYVAKNSVLTFVPGGPLTQTVNITINSDIVVEGNETLFVLLSGAVNATVSKARGAGTINNDDTSG